MAVKEGSKILLVDAEAKFAKALVAELEAAGYQVFHAADGLRALELHAEEKPNLLILD